MPQIQQLQIKIEGIGNIKVPNQTVIMFFIDRKIRVRFLFEANEIDLLSDDSDAEIIKRVKERVEGRCHEKYGFIIQVTNYAIEVSPPKILSNGCEFVVTFSAIIFKPQKNDLMDIFVTKMSEDTIIGQIGPVEVMIPRTRMPQNRCKFLQDKGSYIFWDLSTGDQLAIDLKSRVKCRCYEIKTQMNSQMKIVAFLDEMLITSLMNRN